MKNQKGFSLIELMITIAILGILAAVAMPAYNGYITNAKMLEAKNNIASLKLAEEEYFLENTEYFSIPANATAADILTATDGLWSPQTGSDGLENFAYVVSTPNNTYTITATGKSGTSVQGKTEIYPPPSI